MYGFYMYKKCSCCKKEKLIIAFYKNRTKKDGRQSRCKDCRKKSDQKRASNPLYLFNKYKRDAIRFKREFKLSQEEFFSFSDSKCTYCGETLEQIRLDRMNNNVGYIIENVTSSCRRCNFMKGKLDKGDFLEHVKKIYLHQEKGIKDEK